MKVCFYDENKLISPKTGLPGGDSLGYYTGASYCRRAMEVVGIELVSESPDVYFQYVPPHFVKRLGEPQVLYTMWETAHFPKLLAQRINKNTDFVIVPSKFSLESLRNGGVDKPIYIVRHGIDTDFWIFKERDLNEKQILWVGAPNLRKGYDLVSEIFGKAFLIQYPEAEVKLWIKSTQYSEMGSLRDLYRFKTVIDTRNLSPTELLDLYHKSLILLYPTRGEGVGLPLLEAMSTGMLVLAPPFRVMSEYITEEVAIPLKYSLVEVDYGVSTYVAEVWIEDAVEKLLEIYKSPEKFINRGWEAAQLMRKEYTLEKFGDGILKVLKGIVGGAT